MSEKRDSVDSTSHGVTIVVHVTGFINRQQHDSAVPIMRAHLSAHSAHPLASGEPHATAR